MTRTIDTLRTVNPIAIRAIHEAFDAAIEQLERRGQVPCTDPLRALLAQRIVTLARQGERDPRKLQDEAISSLFH